jgi:chromosome segregation ATPase
MLEKHLRRIKKAETGVPQEDEWEEIPTLGQKMDDQFIEEVPDRTVRIERTNKTNLESFEEDSPKIIEDFHNAAQYAKLIKNHVQEKKSEFEKFKQDKVKFDKQISELKPKKPEMKFDLGKLDYKEVKVTQLKQELNVLEEEREVIKNSITHFNNQINQAQSELSFKVEQIDEIQLELNRLEKKEALQNPIKTEQEAIDIIKAELGTIGSVEESKKIFRTVNTLVNLLKSKNELTVKELRTVKAEFRELQNKYVELMSRLK